jgi:hypothetical protein
MAAIAWAARPPDLTAWGLRSLSEAALVIRWAKGVLAWPR